MYIYIYKYIMYIYINIYNVYYIYNSDRWYCVCLKSHWLLEFELHLVVKYIFSIMQRVNITWLTIQLQNWQITKKISGQLLIICQFRSSTASQNQFLLFARLGGAWLLGNVIANISIHISTEFSHFKFIH